MRKSSLLLQCLVFCAIGVNNSFITTTNIDFAGTHQEDLTRVQKKVDIKYQFRLNGVNQWNQYEGMFIEFELQLAQYVTITYVINIWLHYINWFASRVIIDGVENTEFRRSAGDSDHHVSLFATEDVWLKAGKHTVMVQYRTNRSDRIKQQDYTNNYFKVKYFKK